MITICYGPAECTVTSDSRKELKKADMLLNRKLSFWSPGAFFSAKYHGGLWDGQIHFYKFETHKFPTGLVGVVAKTLSKADMEVALVGWPEPHTEFHESIELRDGSKLRPYQVEAVNKVLKYKRGILKAATNAGKTELACGLIQELGVPDTVFIVPRLELLDQTILRFETKLGIKCNAIGKGQRDLKPGVTIAMFQTLVKLLQSTKGKKWAQNIKVLIADECQFSAGPSYRDCVKKIPADIKMGMSGTPYEESDKIEKHKVTGLFGPILYDVSNAELIEMGVSVRPSIFLAEPRTATVEAGIWEVAQEAAIYKNTVRNRIIATMAKGFVESGRQTLVMVNTIYQGQEILRHIPWAVFAHAESTNRAEVKQRLDAAEVFCLIVTPIFDTGISTDHIEAMIMASGGRSQIQVLQRVGRGLRQSKLKQKDFWVVDFMDRHNEKTRKQSNARKKIYTKEEAFRMVDNIHELPEEVLKHLNPTDFHPRQIEKKLL